MGKASKWFRSLWSSKSSPGSSPAKEKNKKSKWSLSNSGDNSGKLRNHVDDPLASPYFEGIDANKHAIAVAAATAVVAEAALAAAQAAAEVVRLTRGGRSGRGAQGQGVSEDRRLVSAAVNIQSAFRAYLARRALRALKGLVKLQALVRGHIVRKQSSDMLRRMQAMARIQARASARRSYTSEYSNAKTKFSYSHHSGFADPRKYEERSNSVKNGGSLLKPNHSRSRTGISVNKETSQIASRWLNHWMEQYEWEKNLHETSLENRHGDDERSDKILEIDTSWNPYKTQNDRTTHPTQYFSAWDDTKTGPASRIPSNPHKPNPSISSEDDQVPARPCDNSSGVHSASCRPAGNVRGPPARSECSRSLFDDYLPGHPNYMANTESSRAKVRSHSAPKQRMQLEEIGLSRDFSEYSNTVSRQGTPTRNAVVGFSSVYGRRI